MSNLASLYLEGKECMQIRKRVWTAAKYITQYQPDGFGVCLIPVVVSHQLWSSLAPVTKTAMGVRRFRYSLCVVQQQIFTRNPLVKLNLLRIHRGKMTAEQVAKAQELSKELLKTMEAKVSRQIIKNNSELIKE